MGWLDDSWFASSQIPVWQETKRSEVMGNKWKQRTHEAALTQLTLNPEHPWLAGRTARRWTPGVGPSGGRQVEKCKNVKNRHHFSTKYPKKKTTHKLATNKLGVKRNTFTGVNVRHHKLLDNCVFQSKTWPTAIYIEVAYLSQYKTQVNKQWPHSAISNFESVWMFLSSIAL